MKSCQQEEIPSIVAIDTRILDCGIKFMQE